MRKLSKSQKSPFNLGFIKNCSYLFCNKKYYNTQEDDMSKKYIDWAKILDGIANK
jgi:hypothetical protein